MAGLITPSNAVTGLRLACVPIFFLAIGRGAWPLACALFWLAVSTDLVDGRIARARGEATRFGGLLDHATDALFVTTGLAALTPGGVVPVVLPALVATAFVQYVLDSRWLAGEPLRASGLGRWNGILYFVPLGIVTTREAAGLALPGDAVVTAIAWALVATTALSIADRAGALMKLRGRVRNARDAGASPPHRNSGEVDAPPAPRDGDSVSS
ncbi:MAG: CDP-alcohol phosphatidyltransferase family protein [Myxococcota bacterium]